MKELFVSIILSGFLLLNTGCDVLVAPFKNRNQINISETGGSKTVMKNADSPEDYTIYTADEKRNNPLAGEPDYIYLIMGEEGVVIDGPKIDLKGIEDPDEIMNLDEGSIIEFIEPDEVCNCAKGIRAIINYRLTFDVLIDDFEYEIALESLSTITFTREDNILKTSFIFLAIGNSGVAHDITIYAIINNQTVSTSTPVTIEVRDKEED